MTERNDPWSDGAFLIVAAARGDVGELRLPDKEPVADYVRSMSLTQTAGDPERHVAAVLSLLPAAPGAIFTVTTHAGCLICEV